MNSHSSWQQALPNLFPQQSTLTLEKTQRFALSTESMVFFLTGKAYLYAYCPELYEPLLVNYLTPGAWILNTKAPLYLTLKAREKTTLLTLNASQVKTLCQQYVDFVEDFMQQARDQSQQILQRLCWQKLTACERVKALLTLLYSEHEHLDMNHSELALMAGTTRETISRSLYKLRQQGAIEAVRN